MSLDSRLPVGRGVLEHLPTAPHPDHDCPGGQSHGQQRQSRLRAVDQQTETGGCRHHADRRPCVLSHLHAEPRGAPRRRREECERQEPADVQHRADAVVVSHHSDQPQRIRGPQDRRGGEQRPPHRPRPAPQQAHDSRQTRHQEQIADRGGETKEHRPGRFRQFLGDRRGAQRKERARGQRDQQPVQPYAHRLGSDPTDDQQPHRRVSEREEHQVAHVGGGGEGLHLGSDHGGVPGIRQRPDGQTDPQQQPRASILLDGDTSQDHERRTAHEKSGEADQVARGQRAHRSHDEPREIPGRADGYCRAEPGCRPRAAGWCDGIPLKVLRRPSASGIGS